MTVLAYESEDNFYPVNWDKMQLVASDSNGSLIYSGKVDRNTSDNKFYFGNSNLNGVNMVHFYRDSATAFTFPYDSELYDYYLLGTLVANTSDVNLSTFNPTLVCPQGYESGLDDYFNYSVSDLLVYDIDTFGVKGFGFSEKVNFTSVNNIGLNSIYLGCDSTITGKLPGKLVAEFGFLAIEKSASELDALSQILAQLQSMESSINGSLGEAADKIAGAIENQYAMSDSEDLGVGQIADQVEEKLGVLTFGADTLHNFLDLFSAVNVGGTELTFPAFQIEVQGVSYNVWQDVTFDLSFLEEHFGVLITAVRTVTVLCVWLAVLGYLVKAKDHFINNKG